jgi:putative FmdB family regulatory protein
MPLYDYACTRCGRIHEVRHGFDETHEAPCDACGAPLRRVFSAAPVLFKGSGFYVTDSRRSDGAPKPEKPEKPKAEPAAEKTSAPDSGAKSGAKSESSGGSGASESAA